MKMKNKKVDVTVLIISSFFIGCIVGILLIEIICSKDVENDTLPKTIKNVKNAVVSIEAVNGSVVQSTGSGFIYKKTANKAYILTNDHVVGETTVNVINAKGEKTTGMILGKDSKLDLAVIEINSKYAPKTAVLGNSAKMEIGDDIFVIGSPLSEKYAGTVTKGIISGKNRTVPTDLDNPEETLLGGIQFDASVNPGNSGGAVFNLKGEVIGICTMKFIKLEIEGMGFAIPIEQAKNYLNELEKGKTIKRPELGILMVESSNKIELDNYNIKIDNDTIQGIVVLEVKENSNADNKLKKGDIITQIDEIKIRETDDIKKILLTHKKGDMIQINLIRNNSKKKIKIKLN